MWFAKPSCDKCSGPLLRDDGREEFKLTDPFWRRIKGHGQTICLDCVEARLGRELKFADFAVSILNASDRLDTPRLALRKLRLMGGHFGRSWRRMLAAISCS